MSSRTKIRKFLGSNQFISTRKTQHIKKCPISRINIVNFDTLTLYQNVSYKMVRMTGLARSNLLRRNSDVLPHRHRERVSSNKSQLVNSRRTQYRSNRNNSKEKGVLLHSFFFVITIHHILHKIKTRQPRLVEPLYR